MHLPRRSLLATTIGLCLVASLPSVATARTTHGRSNPVAVGFQPRALAFFDEDNGIIAGSIVCSTCARHRMAAISTTDDAGMTWSAPTTFHAGVASAITVASAGADAWALVGTRLQHSGDGGATWSILPKAGVSSVTFATAMDGWAIRRTTTSTEIVETGDGGATWSPGPAPCRSGASAAVFVTRTTIDDGWAVCGGDAAAGSLRQVVWRTTDAGTTWTRGFHGVAAAPAGYRFLDDGHGWRWHYVFADVFGTTDGGGTWDDLGSAGNVLVADLWFVSDARGYAISARPNGASNLLISVDGGHGWRAVTRFPAN